jgi:glyoxylase-like metal-dependent hydrolase (beta-lactamase superfamily II)
VIYVTHPHPDHLFGLAVLHQAFPSAKIVALPATVAGAKTGWPARQKFWFPTYGNNIPGPEPVLPEELSSPMLTLEGEQFPITGGVQGDGPGNSFVYIPSLKAVVAGDTVYRLLRVPRQGSRDWMKTLDQIAALKPGVVPSGVRREERPVGNRVHEEAIADWDANVKASKRPPRCVKVLKQYRAGDGVYAQRRITAFTQSEQGQVTFLARLHVLWHRRLGRPGFQARPDQRSLHCWLESRSR